MPHPELKPTWLLKHLLILSSILVTIFGLSFIIAGSEIEKLIGTCLAIPFSSFYLKTGKIKLKPVYWINDLHFSFWIILSVLIFHKGVLYWGVPVSMSCLFFLVILKRKENFILKECDSN
jgi:hypothetical protein